MANSITNRTLIGGVNSPRIIKYVHIISDGTQEDGYVLFDNSEFWNDPTCGSVVNIKAMGSDALMFLEWDATVDDTLCAFNSGGDFELDFVKFGGISNPGSAGATGDILLGTLGLEAGNQVTLIVEIKR